MAPIGEIQLKSLVDAQVFGARSEWEKHEIGGQATFVKPIAVSDVHMKACIANRFDELGFIPKFFREQGREFVALEGVKQSRYADVEAAFVDQILTRL
ncbi:MAG: hypothetical protein V4735_03170 [Pseudomonadota bacterium]